MPKSPSELGTRLREALDNLIDAARQVAPPGWIWIAGIVYPSVQGGLEVVDVRDKLEKLNFDPIDLGFLSFESLSLEGVWESLTQEGEAQVNGLLLLLTGGIGLLLVVLLLLLLMSRLTVGLAACTSPEAWAQSGDPTRRPGLRTAWQIGKGMTLSAFGIRVLLDLMRIFAILLIGLPTLFAEDILSEGGGFGQSFLLYVVFLPLAGILMVYFVVLSALHQLALHSLVQNRRGMASALRHAWRLFRVDAPISLSYLIVEGSVFLVFYLVGMMIGVASSVICCLIPTVLLLSFSLKAFQGVLRAAFWARAYRHMGGATSADTFGGVGTSPSQI